MDVDQESEKRYDAMTVWFMAAFAALPDLLTVLGIMALAVPVVGLVLFIFALIVNFVVVVSLTFWFIMKEERSLIVWIVNIVGFLLGLFLPVKCLTVLVATFLGNSKMAQEIAKDVALAAVTVATAGAAAPVTGAAAAAGTAGAATAGAAAAAGGATAAGATAAGGAAAAGTAAAEGVSGAAVRGAEAVGEKAAAQGAGAAEKSAAMEERFGMEKEPLEKVKEVMERIPTSEKEKGEGEVDLDNDQNTIDLSSL